MIYYLLLAFIKFQTKYSYSMHELGRIIGEILMENVCLIETLRFLEQNHPYYLFNSPIYNTKITAVPINKIKFHFKPARESKVERTSKIGWENKILRRGDFELKINSGEISQGEVVGILGPNGIGKTTFIKFLAGTNDSEEEESPLKGFDLSYKPQYVSTEYSGEVRSLFSSLASSTYGTDKFESDFARPLGLNKLLDRNLRDLSGGELQRVAITACLSRSAQIYLLDEPSAYLDVEERLAVAKLMRRIAEERAAFVFVVEHDIVAQDFISDRLMVFDGEPGISGLAHKPVSLRNGMNSFLSIMGITFRRDPDSGRPRVNKLDSKIDRSQKDNGEYYYVPTTSRD